MFGNWFSQVRNTFKLNFVSRKTLLWNVSPGQNHRHSWSICSVSEIPDVSLRDCSSAFEWPHPHPEETRQGIAARRLVLHNSMITHGIRPAPHLGQSTTRYSTLK